MTRLYPSATMAPLDTPAHPRRGVRGVFTPRVRPDFRRVPPVLPAEPADLPAARRFAEAPLPALADLAPAFAAFVTWRDVFAALLVRPMRCDRTLAGTPTSRAISARESFA